MHESSNSYDLVPYESHPYRQTHPSRLATMGTLFGMRPAPIGQCRVIELGCAAGGNLIPMAVQLPGSQFLGVDLSGRQVDEGRQLIARLKLSNIELRHASIADIGDGDGQFDYLLCHGVFSWVPTAVQEAIFRSAQRNLKPHGIAYISYNTYPGWHMRGLIREMMRYHAANYATPTIRTRQARGLLDFLAGSVPQDGSAFSALLRQEVEVLRHHPDHYLFHEHLEDVNSPLFFHQFIERATGFQLQYLSEANLRSMIAGNLPESVEKALRVMATDQIQLEQDMDFLRNRTFRETLLCHAGMRLNRALDAEPLRRLSIASAAEPAKDVGEVNANEEISFRTAGGYTLTTSLPLMKAAFLCLRECWPQPVPFDRLVALVEAKLGTAGTKPPLSPEAINVLATRLLHAYVGSDLVELFAGVPPFVTEPGDSPLACPLARDQALRGNTVTNRRHEVVRLNPFQRAVLPLLDGARDGAALHPAVVETLAREGLRLRDSEGERGSREPEQQAIGAGLKNAVQEFARFALLIG